MARKKENITAPASRQNSAGSIKDRAADGRQAAESRMALSWDNYKWMLVGLALIVLGFILMGGSSNDDPAVFDEKIFSFRRITLAPIVLLAGFAVEIYAILKKPKRG